MKPEDDSEQNHLNEVRHDILKDFLRNAQLPDTRPTRLQALNSIDKKLKGEGRKTIRDMDIHDLITLKTSLLTQQFSAALVPITIDQLKRYTDTPDPVTKSRMKVDPIVDFKE